MKTFNRLNKGTRNELIQHLIDCINDRDLVGAYTSEFHQVAFNEDYYIIYYSEALKWIKTSGLDTFDIIDVIKEYQMDLDGTFTTDINPEAVVNMFAYVVGEELIYSIESYSSLESDRFRKVDLNRILHELKGMLNE